MQAEDVDWTAAKRLQRAVDQTIAPEDRQQPGDGGDDRQDEGRAHEQDQRVPSRKPAAGQRAGHGDCQQRAEQRRKGSLKDGEAQGRPVGGRRPARAPRPPQHGGQGGEDQHGDRQGRRAADPQRESAARHSSSAASRVAGTSPGAIRRDWSGWMSDPNPSGRPFSGITAGYIQLVVGITDCAGSETR